MRPRVSSTTSTTASVPSATRSPRASGRTRAADRSIEWIFPRTAARYCRNDACGNRPETKRCRSLAALFLLLSPFRKPERGHAPTREDALNPQRMYGPADALGAFVRSAGFSDIGCPTAWIRRSVARHGARRLGGRPCARGHAARLFQQVVHRRRRGARRQPQHLNITVPICEPFPRPSRRCSLRPATRDALIGLAAENTEPAAAWCASWRFRTPTAGSC